MFKKRTLSLLLSLAMLLTFMPAMAFAEDAADENTDQPAAVETVEDAVVEEADVEEPAVVEATVEDTAVEEHAAEEAVEPKEALDAEEEPVPVSLTYTGPTLTYEPWDEGPQYIDTYQEGMKFVLKYSVGPDKTIVLKQWGTETHEGETYPLTDFFFEDEEPNVVKDEEGYEYANNAIYFDFDKENASKTSMTVKYEYYANGEDKVLETSIPVAEKQYPKPEKIEFVPANNFVAGSCIGEKELYSGNFFGEGNKFVVTWKTGDVTEVKEYVAKDTGSDWGFVYEKGDESEWLWMRINLDKRVAKGTADYTGKAVLDTAYGEMSLPFTAKVSASMYWAYVENKTYSYTGKNIKPKVVVKYFDGKKMKKMPAKWYTCKPKKHKAIGSYEFTVKIKKKYQKKYGASLWGGWVILPKTPTIKKVTAGKGSLTVTWTKFSKSAQKGIDGFIVQASKDKSFDSWSEEDEVKKNVAKATLKDLEPGTYYVRVVSIKTVKTGGDGSPWWSKPSKVKAVSVKEPAPAPGD